MQTRFVLYILDYQLIVYQVSRHAVQELQRFPATLEGQEAFVEWLPDSPLKPLFSPVSVLLDSRQEEYQVVQVPHVIGPDRKDLLNHRMQRQFPNNPYTHAQIQGRVTNSKDNSRRDDQVLLMACGNSDLLDVWMTPLLEQRISIRGIYSVALLLEQVLPLLEAPDYTLVVCQTEQVTPNVPRGMRQAFFRKGHLVLSRLTPLPDFANQEGEQRPKDDNSIASAYVEHMTDEILKTRQYLRGVNLLPHRQPLTVCMFPDPELLESLGGPLSRRMTRALDYQLWDSRNFVRQQGIRAVPNNAYLSIFAAHQLARKNLRNHYALPNETLFFNHLKIRRYLQWGSLALCLGAAGLSGLSTYQALQTKDNIDTARQLLQQTEQRYEQARAQQRQELGVSVDVLHIKNTVDVARALQQQHLEPYSAVALLGQYLTDFPQLAVEELAWKRTKDETEDKRTSSSRPLSALQRRYLEKQRALSRQEGEKTIQVITLSGQVRPFNGDVIQAQQTVNNFISTLNQADLVRKVKTLDSPLKLNLQEAFNGSNLNATVQSEENNASFALEIVLDVEQSSDDVQ